MDKDGDISIKNNFFPENVFKTENISKLGRSHEFALHGEYALKRLADDYQEDGPISQVRHIRKRTPYRRIFFDDDGDERKISNTPWLTLQFYQLSAPE